MTRIRIVRESCSDCPFAGRFVGLRSGRLKDIADQLREGDAYFVCHQTMFDEDGDEPDTDAVFGKAAVCPGSLEVYEASVVQIARRIDAVEYVDPKETAS